MVVDEVAFLEALAQFSATLSGGREGRGGREKEEVGGWWRSGEEEFSRFHHALILITGSLLLIFTLSSDPARTYIIQRERRKRETFSILMGH